MLEPLRDTYTCTCISIVKKRVFWFFLIYSFKHTFLLCSVVGVYTCTYIVNLKYIIYDCEFIFFFIKSIAILLQHQYNVHACILHSVHRADSHACLLISINLTCLVESQFLLTLCCFFSRQKLFSIKMNTWKNDSLNFSHCFSTAHCMCA